MQGQLGHTIHFQKICIAFRKNLQTGLSENFLIFWESRKNASVKNAVVANNFM